MKNFTAFTKEEKGLIRVLKTQVAIVIDEKLNPNYIKAKDRYIAIWDTGATNTVISEKLAKELHLTSIGKANVSTAGGLIEVDKYIIDLKLPNSLRIQNVMVTSGKLSDTDFLIGMDIITLGDFSVTNLNGKTTFSFRYPSCETINYVEQAKRIQRKNLEKQLKAIQKNLRKKVKCPCGSGRQFRYCHGKEQIKKIEEELEKIGV